MSFFQIGITIGKILWHGLWTSYEVQNGGFKSIRMLHLSKYIDDLIKLNSPEQPYPPEYELPSIGIEDILPGIPLFPPNKDGVVEGDIYPIDSMRDAWNDAENAQPTPPRHYDPLVLDLNRDGKINLDNATFFDLNASGFHEYTRWISETDAFLVLDINGNGKIDNGSEMFGDSMRLPDGSIALSGFDALRSYDSNGDGKIDANDDIFSSLKLLTGAGQLVTLGDAGVKSINIPDRTRLPEFNGGNLPRDERIRQDYQRWLNGGVNATHGSFEWDDGTEGAIDEVLPYRIPMYSIPDAKWDVPDEIAALPNLFGQGVLYDLQQIMAIDGSGVICELFPQKFLFHAA